MEEEKEEKREEFIWNRKGARQFLTRMGTNVDTRRRGLTLRRTRFQRVPSEPRACELERVPL